MTIRPYISVSNALEAMDLYSNIFDAEKVEHVPVTKEQAEYFKMPDDTDFSKTTMHGAFKIGEDHIYISDNFTGKRLAETNISIMVEPKDLDHMKKIYASAEEAGCEITMKLEKQFWGDYFTSFKDPFGISWQMNYSPRKDD